MAQASGGRPSRGSIPRIKLRRLAHAEGLPLPAYATPAAAGVDLVAAVADGAPLRLEPGARVLVPTGLVLELPAGFEGQVRPRSGMALRHGITVLNSPGTIDADYRGEIGVILVNLGDKAFEVARGDRIAQLVLARVAEVRFVEVSRLGLSARGEGGFGSTGTTARAAGAGTAVTEGGVRVPTDVSRPKSKRQAPSRRPVKTKSAKSP